MNELTKNLINSAFAIGVFTVGYFIGKSNDVKNTSPSVVYSHDFTGDGLDDLLVVSSDGHQSLFVGNKVSMRGSSGIVYSPFFNEVHAREDSAQREISKYAENTRLSIDNFLNAKAEDNK